MVVFLQYLEVIRQIIYTTNTIECLNSQLSKVTNNKRSFLRNDPFFPTLYLKLHYAKMEYAHSKLGRSYGPFFDKFEGRV